MMAILCLARSVSDLEDRLARIVVGIDRDGSLVTAEQLGASGAMAALLATALQLNLVQSCEGVPAIVHGRPFGNLAHGCSSVLGTRMALALGDVCVTEAGFGADLGGEKFVQIKVRQSGLVPDAAVLVASVRALKLHGGVAPTEVEQENLAAVEAGFADLARHAENLGKFGLPAVVAINRFRADMPAEIRACERLCEAAGLPAAVADPWGEGGAGCEELARRVTDGLETPASFRLLYRAETPLREKVMTVAREIYRAASVEFLPAAAHVRLLADGSVTGLA